MIKKLELLLLWQSSLLVPYLCDGFSVLSLESQPTTGPRTRRGLDSTTIAFSRVFLPLHLSKSGDDDDERGAASSHNTSSNNKQKPRKKGSSSSRPRQQEQQQPRTGSSATTPLESWTSEAQAQQPSSTWKTNNKNNNNNILEDSTGHVNRVLAERIFDWEQELRRASNLPTVDYSIRSGLRLVEELVQQQVLQTSSSSSPRNKITDRANTDDSLYSDLVQEGLVALLDAMKHYREEEHNEGFAVYAKTRIQHQLQAALQSTLSNRAVKLPQSVRSLVQRAKLVAQQWQSSNHTNNKKPTLANVAEALGVPAAQLRDYLDLYKRTQPPTLSMESTVEIMHPLLDDSTVQFTDQDDWEKEHLPVSSSSSSDGRSSSFFYGSESSAASSSSNSKKRRRKHNNNNDNQDSTNIQAEQWISEYNWDDLLEGDDQAWIVQQEQYAGNLQDVIPDLTEPSPDTLALSEMIRHDVYEFLASTLTQQEHAVIRSVFGLDTGKQQTLKRTAAELGLESIQHASLLLAGGLQKLRDSYTKRYVEPYLDDGGIGGGGGDDDTILPTQRIVDSV